MRISPATLSDLSGIMPLVTAAVGYMDTHGIFQWDEVYPGLDVFEADPAAVALYDRRGYRRAGRIELRMGPFWVFERPIVRN